MARRLSAAPQMPPSAWGGMLNAALLRCLVALASGLFASLMSLAQQLDTSPEFAATATRSLHACTALDVKQATSTPSVETRRRRPGACKQHGSAREL